ncbi:cytochrome B562 [Salmonella enterica subsp. enterica serovar Choleraesuis]|nr:cytochrome B562 [Salmonella enterica subsp. enterica serovar Choleraesuis]
MRKTLLAMMTLSAVFLTSTNALASALEKDMDTLGDNFKIVLKTNDVGEMKTALTAMKQAAEDSKKSTPPSLEGKASDSPEMVDYRHGLDTLIAQIDGALTLANEGKVKEAQAAAEEFKQTRSTYHKKYRQD